MRPYAGRVYGIYIGRGLYRVFRIEPQIQLFIFPHAAPVRLPCARIKLEQSRVRAVDRPGLKSGFADCCIPHFVRVHAVLRGKFIDKLVYLL